MRSKLSSSVPAYLHKSVLSRDDACMRYVSMLDTASAVDGSERERCGGDGGGILEWDVWMAELSFTLPVFTSSFSSSLYCTSFAFFFFFLPSLFFFLPSLFFSPFPPFSCFSFFTSSSSPATFSFFFLPFSFSTVGCPAFSSLLASTEAEVGTTSKLTILLMWMSSPSPTLFALRSVWTADMMMLPSVSTPCSSALLRSDVLVLTSILYRLLALLLTPSSSSSSFFFSSPHSSPSFFSPPDTA
mmetsp:Transcript_26283/g.66900  ORF Transcript_26283/g.66900 Transcript_26283/m.66900 type:complete len:243 (-) Transcript_26283:145-873(-)